MTVKEYQFKFVKTTLDGVYTRKNDGDQLMKIVLLVQLQKLDTNNKLDNYLNK